MMDFLKTAILCDWTREEIQALYEQPFLDLVSSSESSSWAFHDANTIQVSAFVYQLKRANALKIANAALNLHVMIQN